MPDRPLNSEQLKHLELAATYAGIGYWRYDFAKDAFYLSREAARVHGIAEGTVLNMESGLDYVHPDDRDQLAEVLQACVADRAQKEAEARIIHSDGHMLRLFYKVDFEADQDGAVTALVGIVQDITDRTLVQQRLQQTIVETVSSAIIGLNDKRQVVSINPAGRHILGGLTIEPPFAWPSEIAFLDSADMRPLEASHDPISRAMIGQKINGEIHLMTRSTAHEGRYVRVASAPVELASAGLKCVVVIDDVSEAERSRQQIERQSRLDALGQLTGGIAHDFNNLMGTVSYAIENMRFEGLTEFGEQSADTALRTIKRGTLLTQRLLAFAKRQPGRSASVPLSEVWQDLSQLIHPTIEETITLDFVTPGEDLMVFCDSGQLENAILNLVLNSRDAILRSGTGNKITIEARPIEGFSADQPDRSEDGSIHLGEGRRAAMERETSNDDGLVQRYVEICVSDNGPGMTPAVKARAVDPFFTTKDANSGTGLGLSMVYGFVQRADGELRIYSEQGQGTAIRLLLPRGQRDTGVEPPRAERAMAQGNGEKILLVEDERPLQDQMAALLMRLNYNVVLAGNGREALHHLEDIPDIALLVTDIVMPGGMGGFDLAQAARRLRPDIALLYMSGYTGFSDSEMGSAVAPMLAKPSSPAETAQEIRNALRKRTANKG